MVVAHRADDRGELRHLGLGQPGRRLVHQHERRLGRERAGDAEPPLVAVRERAGRRRVRDALEPEQLEQLVGPAPRRPRAAPRRRAPRPRRSRAPSGRETSGCAGTSARSRPGRAGAGSSAVTSRSLELDACRRSARRSPESTFTSVDLPAPFGPIRPTTSCRCSSSVTSESACTPAKERETAEARSVPPGLRSRRGGVGCGQVVLELRDDLGRHGARRSCALLFSILITRYCRPNTVWYCRREADEAGQRRHLPELLHRRRERRAVRRAAGAPDRRHDTVDRRRARRRSRRCPPSAASRAPARPDSGRRRTPRRT